MRKHPQRKISYLLIFFALDVIVCVFTAMFLLIYTPEPGNKSFDHDLDIDDQNIYNNQFLNKLNITESKWSQKIRFLLQESFLAYFSTCQNSDYLQPISRNCMNSSGLSLTTIESLEALYISGLRDEYLVASNFILNDFHFTSNSFQNFHEMGTKVLGGLIGIYGLTSNYKYIEKAIECADLMLISFSNSIPYPLINGKKSKPIKYDFFNGNFLSESSGFILEFTALSKITGNNKYISFVEKYLSCVNSLINNEKTFPSFLSVDKCSVIGDHRGFNGFTFSFIANVIRLHLYSPNKITLELVDFIINYFSRFTSSSTSDQFLKNEDLKNSFDSSFCQLTHLLDNLKLNLHTINRQNANINRVRHIDNVNEIPANINNDDDHSDVNFDTTHYEIILEKFQKILKSVCNSFSVFSESDSASKSFFSNKEMNFYYGSDPLVNYIFSGKELDQLRILNIFDRTKCDSAQCALISQNPILYDDIMPSESLGKWLKFLFLAYSSVDNDFVINEAGHLIPKIII
ncbi:hypothetical protein TRFO_11054 [Tritrichomonas foetus]|uniref:alpha-1,2-Mannosidase n=1 Tax=Tritrichomonas foetus TaxID=1144522 RepID=A0A1J4J5C0_9EUKA|nr:hypothetical protein TRFO_11054 [Tritrichomonas foetus]|eukprot:OHS94454.1 hypothetical protein TRFO_11054 [Tritrichomonas foetus]